MVRGGVGPIIALTSTAIEIAAPGLGLYDGAVVAGLAADVKTLQPGRLQSADIVRHTEVLPSVELSAPVQASIASVQAISLSEFVQALDHRVIQTQLDELRSHWKLPQEAAVGTLEVATGVSASLSVGYVVWLLRGGVLMGSMLSALPAWQMIDPLPILSRGVGGRGREGEDEDGVETLFRRGPARASRPVQAAKSEPSPGGLPEKEEA